MAKTILALMVLLLACAASGALAQSNQDSQVVLMKLSPPVWHSMARLGNLSGTVEVEVTVRPDGAVEGARLVRGDEMFLAAALGSATTSTFECRGCVKAVSFVLTFFFERKEEGDCCTAINREPNVTFSGDRVTSVAARSCICDPAPAARIRSIKCIWLWKCGWSR